MDQRYTTMLYIGGLDDYFHTTKEEQMKNNKCIRAYRDGGGIISISPESNALVWADIAADAERVELVEHLAGWGEWTQLYRVHYGDGTRRLYAVQGEEMGS